MQDDFVALMPGGKVYATEAGCFAKTFALSAEDEPTIYGAVTRPEAYLENVSQDDDGELDFFDTSYTQNGRATFSFSSIEAGDARELESADFLLILNRNENIIPAVAKLNAEQAAAYFMLGETQGTSAGGAEEAGKFLRVPGTNPFFPDDHDQQGNRFLELMGEHPLEVYLMNTGRVGGADDVDGSREGAHPALVGDRQGRSPRARSSGSDDPDFGYEVARAVPGIDEADAAVLRPRELYEKQGRRRVREDRRPTEGRADGVPEEVPGALGRDRGGRFLERANRRPRGLRLAHSSAPWIPLGSATPSGGSARGEYRRSLRTGAQPLLSALAVTARSTLTTTIGVKVERAG